MMPELSSAAQEVLTAFNKGWGPNLPAALRAAAGHGADGLTTEEHDTGWRAAMDFIDAIADELEAQ